MPYSKDQQTAARIAMHAPGKLHKRNRGMLSMSKKELQAMATRPISEIHAESKTARKRKK